MGRPKAFDRDAAVQTVMNEMWKNGYQACSVKAISEKLGITRSSFYNTFGSRESLFFEVLDAYIEQSPDKALSHIQQNDKVLLSLCHVFKHACEVRSCDPEARGCLAINSITELVGTDENIGPKLESAIQYSINRFEQVLTMAVENGELKNENLHTKALALQNLLIGINVLSKVIHDLEELWQPTRHTLISLGLYQKSFDEVL